MASLSYSESEVLQMAYAVERTALHPVAKAIVNKAEAMNLSLPGTRGQLSEPGYGTLAEVDGHLVAVGSLDWVHERFHRRTDVSGLLNLKEAVTQQLSKRVSVSKDSQTVVYVGREGEGIIGAIAISDGLRQDAKSTVTRLVSVCLRYTHLATAYTKRKVPTFSL